MVGAEKQRLIPLWLTPDEATYLADLMTQQESDTAKSLKLRIESITNTTQEEE